MNAKQFKIELDAACTDEWGNTMEAWFECAGQMYERGMDIPIEWEYKPSPLGATEEDSEFHYTFLECSNAQLKAIGNLLFRLCAKLKRQGKDY